MDRRWTMMKSSPEMAPNCPRCASSNTKFCYYNNYSLSQPRYFCKGCRRYWTKGGSLRNVPVGGGCRKSRRGRSSRPPGGTISSSYTSSRSDGGGGQTDDVLVMLQHQDAASSNRSSSGPADIDMAAVFAKFLDPNSETEFRDQEETDQTGDDDNPIFDLTSSLGSSNEEGDSFLMDSENEAGLFGQVAVGAEFDPLVAVGDENLEGSYDGSFGLEYEDMFSSDQLLLAAGPEAVMWPANNYGTDAFSEWQQEELELPPFSGNYKQMKGGCSSGNGLVDDNNWTVGSCLDVTNFEV